MSDSIKRLPELRGQIFQHKLNEVPGQKAQLLGFQIYWPDRQLPSQKARLRQVPWSARQVAIHPDKVLHPLTSNRSGLIKQLPGHRVVRPTVKMVLTQLVADTAQGFRPVGLHARKTFRSLGVGSKPSHTRDWQEVFQASQRLYIEKTRQTGQMVTRKTDFANGARYLFTRKVLPDKSQLSVFQRFFPPITSDYQKRSEEEATVMQAFNLPQYAGGMVTEQLRISPDGQQITERITTVPNNRNKGIKGIRQYNQGYNPTIDDWRIDCYNIKKPKIVELYHQPKEKTFNRNA